jgi:hypothetical protein
MAKEVCGRRSCPDCWTVWAQEAGVRATRRLQSFRETQPPDYNRQAGHAVVSPPDGDVMNERQFFDGRSRAAEIAEAKGFRGCAVIPHPWRVTDGAKHEYRKADPDCGIWVWLRRDHAEHELRERIRWSPHYHVIGAMTPDMEPGDESDEWLYEFIRTFEPYESATDRSSHDDVYGTFRYLYSHTGWPKNSTKTATAWYGDLANSVFVEDATESWQLQKPAERVRDRLLREIEAVAGHTDVDGGGDGCETDGDEEGQCPNDDCEGLLIDVFDVLLYLDSNNPPPGVRERMIAAREWRLGDRVPPPGMRKPQTEEQAREAFEAIL